MSNGSENDLSKKKETQDPQEVLDTEADEGTSDDEPIVADSGYTHEILKGKTPQEIEAYVRLVEETNREQGARLTQQERERQREPAPVVEEPAPKPDFFNDPAQVIKDEMRATIAPLMEEVKELKIERRVDDAWAEAKSQIPDFAKYEPYVRKLIEVQGFTPEQITLGLLSTLKRTAVGYIVEQTGTAEPPRSKPVEESRREEPVASIPQHRPSSSPLPESKKSTKVRDLTENERRLARERGMSPEEYVRWQEMDETEVLTHDREKEKTNV